MSRFRDLRAWLELVEAMGELRHVKGADWDLEIGAITDLVTKKPINSWALLFDEIKGYPAGYRLLTGLLGSLPRLALTIGLDPGLKGRDFVLAWRDRLKNLTPIAPETVSHGTVLENIQSGREVNLYKFPVPRWQNLDGGRYIGTASMTVTRDPDEGSVNFGTYRVMVHSENSAGFYISPGKHGRIHRDKYFAHGKPCPVAIVIGEDPLLYLASTLPITHVKGGFETEYHWAGALRGEPIRVVNGKVTGLPIPADAEAVLEGVAYPGEEKIEGPFGEWTGYYASQERSEPVIRVESIYHRNDPILCGTKNGRVANTYGHELLRAAQLWGELEAAGLPGIQGIAFYQGRFIAVVSIKQLYAGHAKSAAMLAMHCHASAYLGRYVIVVDDDIDVYDFSEVLWAISTRVDPVKDIEIVTNCWSGPLDPIIPPEDKGTSSRAVIDATKPYRWHKKFPISNVIDPSLKAKVLKNWQSLFND